jgi:hypothetical protein
MSNSNKLKTRVFYLQGNSVKKFFKQAKIQGTFLVTNDLFHPKKEVSELIGGCNNSYIYYYNIASLSLSLSSFPFSSYLLFFYQ